MKKKYFGILIIFLIIFFNIDVFAQNKIINALEKADNSFKDKNYIQALNYYKEAFSKEKNNDLKKDIQLKILETLKLIKRWDTLILDLEKNIKNEKDNKRLVELYLFAGFLYKDIEHNGYKIDNKVYRDKSKREGIFVYTYYDDIAKAYSYFIKAKKIYVKENINKENNEKIININLEIIDILKNNSFLLKEKIENKKLKDEEKIISLLDEIIGLNKLVKKDYYNAKALFEKGIYIFKLYRYEKNNKYKEVIDIFQSIIDKSPKEKLSEESLYSIGEIYLINNEIEKAINTFNKLIKNYPKSIRVTDCKANLQDIYRKSLYISPIEVQSPKFNSKISINFKNINKINLEVFQADFKDREFDIIDNSYLKKGNYYNKSILKKDIELSNNNKFKINNEILDLGILKEGSYIIKINDYKDNSAIALLLVSNITIIQNNDINKVYIYTLERDTGKPINNSNIFIREHNYNDNRNYIIKAKTDNNGLYIYDKQRKEYYSSSISIIATKDRDLTFSDINNYYYFNNKEKIYKAYTYTDRPIYKPNDKVNFKSIIKVSDAGELKNLLDKKIKVIINNPKNEKIYEKYLELNKFGTINDSFLLDKNSSLGTYNIYTYINGVEQTNNFGIFRVEEYKKPEFTVKINSKNNTLYSGDKIGLNINAIYYFGLPVVNAKVHYKIVRNKIYQYDYIPFYRKINYLSSNYKEEATTWKEGDLTTNENGETYLEFDTEKTDINYNYQILVDITDNSRRNIKAGKSIKVTQKEFSASINFEKNLYTNGEKVNIDISLKNYNDEPIVNSGKLIIKKIEDEKEITVLKEELKSDLNGKINYKWKSNKEGLFKIIFETSDKRENIISSEKKLFIMGNNFNSKNYKFENLEIITDKQNYNIGDTAKIMINSDLPNSYIIFFIEAGSEIIDNRIIRVKDKSVFLNLKIEKKHIPNFNIKIAMIKDNKLFIENNEISVISPEQFINIDIETNKNEYLPSEKGKIKIRTSDYNGKPISSEISLSVIDKSLLYLQNNNNIDIKDFFYGDKRIIDKSIFSSLYPYLYSSNKDNFKYIDYKRNPSYLDYFSSRLLMEAPLSMPTPSALQKKTSLEDKKNISGNMIIPNLEIRSYFNDTALWEPNLFTNSKGIAEIELKFPDSLTTWLINSNATDTKARVGNANKEIITKKNIMIRLQAPRFFVEKDEVNISAIVNNDFNFPQNINCEIELPEELELISNKFIREKINAKSEKRFDWRVKVKKEGNIYITVKAIGNNESDAVKEAFPIYIHGINKTIFSSSYMKNNTQKNIDIFVPNEIKVNSEKISINLSSSVLSVMIDAIPYLIEYPYGCIEQTTSRFIPLVMLYKTMQDLNINLEDIKKINYNFKNPIYNSNEVQKMLKIGLDKIYQFQNSDGGWGWWNGFKSDPYMSAYVIYSLNLAKEANYKIDNSVIKKGLDYLKNELDSNNTDIYNNIYISFVLSASKDIKESSLDKFFISRDSLNNYAKALLSLSYYNLGNKEKASLICENLKSFVNINGDSASWDNQERNYWYWYGDNIETNTFILKAFLKSKPNDIIIPKIVNWLISKRKANIWNSTKDTANIIYTLNDFAKINNEVSPDYTVSVIYNDKLIKKIQVNKENMFDFDNKIIIDNLNIGKSKITLKKEGKGVLYYSSALEYFTLEEGIKKSGKGIDIDREYFKITESKTKLDKDDILKSGDIVEVKLTIKSDNDYEYLVFEDMKASGFETIDLKSGYLFQNDIYYYREFRNEKVAFFLNNLRQGTQVITYRLRAEIPGKFHIMPNSGYTMYSPEIKAISNEMNLQVED